MISSRLLFSLTKSPFKGITEASSSIERIIFLCQNIQHSQGLTSCVSAVAVCTLLGMRVVKAKQSEKRWVQLFPEALLVVIVSILLTDYFDWEKEGLDILGETDASGIPIPSIPAFPGHKHMKDMLVTAAMIAVIGFVESVAIAKTYSSRHNYTVSPNRELVALGLANIVSGLMQGIPAYGSVSKLL